MSVFVYLGEVFMYGMIICGCCMVRFYNILDLGFEIDLCV